jgi:cytochrome c oxidase subunit II
MTRSRSLAGLAAGLLLAGCEGRQSALDPQGPQAAQVHELWNVMLIGSAVVFLVVIALVLVAIALPRQRAAAGDRRRLHLVGLGAGVTTAILVALLVYNVQVSRAVATRPADAMPIHVVAHQWWWEVIYPGDPPSQTVRTANELWLPVGRPVEITLESRDVIHSFWVPNLHGKVDAIPGRTTSLWLQADRPGTFRGQCAELCGLQHARMAFEVVAVSPAELEAWRAAQLEPAQEPLDELARRGQEVFLASSCAMCHAVRGTRAMASVGPDLTHLASRRRLAASTLPNQPGHLGGWILDPQHIKPGAFMPATDLSGDRLDALLRYLGGLR